MAEQISAHNEITAKLENDSIGTAIFTEFSANLTEVSASVSLLGLAVAVLSVPSTSGRIDSCMAGIATGLRWLNYVLVTTSSVKFDEKGNPMDSLSACFRLGDVVAQMNCLTSACLSLRQQEEVCDFGSGTNARTHCYSAKLNFSDWIGPRVI